jgi:hypothetical protein
VVSSIRFFAAGSDMMRAYLEVKAAGLAKPRDEGSLALKWVAEMARIEATKKNVCGAISIKRNACNRGIVGIAESGRYESC